MLEITTAYHETYLYILKISFLPLYYIVYKKIMHTFLPTVGILHLFPCHTITHKLTVISEHLS